MLPIRLSSALLGLACGSLVALGTLAHAQDDGDPEEAVEDVIEEEAEKGEDDGEAAGADLGEASYNTENCEPAEGEDGEGDTAEKDLDECEDMVK